jgi:hypothetical protein
MRKIAMRDRFWVLGAFAWLVVGLVSAGCGSSDKPKPIDTAKKQQEDPWLRVAPTLRQDSDVTTCRRVLSELNQGLASAPVESQRKLSDADTALAQQKLNLSDAEVKEIRSTGYTALDPNYLEEALYLRDIARSLDLAKLPITERAQTVFQWVCRQVVLHPWATPLDQKTVQPNPPMPPSLVLRRGSGSGLERMLVFVALCQQLEMEAYLIGPAEAVGQPMLFQVPGKLTEFPRGPFWSVGVRDRTEILLFDPWKELAYPGKNGRPATLADVRANPREMAVWLDDKAFAWAVTVDDLKKGEVYLIASLSSVTPRNKTLEEKLTAELGVKLFVNLADVKKTAEIAAKEIPVHFYSPASEPYSPTRALSSILPTSEGGTSPESAELYSLYKADQIPKGELLKIPPGLQFKDPQKRLVAKPLSIFAGAFLSAPTPREKIQRGQFVEVTQNLVKLREFFKDADTRRKGTETGTNSALKDWIKQTESLYSRYYSANQAEQPQLSAQIEEFWKQSSPLLEGFLNSAIAQPGLSESTFLLAMAKHEQAERAQSKALRLATTVELDPAKKAAAEKATVSAKASASEAWIDASDWWARYEPYLDYQNTHYPGRAALAKRLAARCKQFAEAK